MADDTSVAPAGNEAATKEGGEAKTDVKSTAGADTKGEPKADAKPAEPTWRDGIADEKAKGWAARFNSPADLATEAYGLRQKISNAILPLGKNPKPEEITEFRKKWGVPLDPTGYKFEMPDGKEASESDQAFHKAMSGAFHEANLSQAQAAKLNGMWNSFTAEYQRQISANDEADMAASAAKLKTKWGSGFDRNVKASKDALDEFQAGTKTNADRLRNLVVRVGAKDTILGNVPEFQEILAFFGNRLMEAKALAPMDEETARTASTRLNELYGLMNTDMAKYRTPEVQKEIRELETARAAAKKRAA